MKIILKSVSNFLIVFSIFLAVCALSASTPELFAGDDDRTEDGCAEDTCAVATGGGGCTGTCTGRDSCGCSNAINKNTCNCSRPN